MHHAHEDRRSVGKWRSVQPRQQPGPEVGVAPFRMTAVPEVVQRLQAAAGNRSVARSIAEVQRQRLPPGPPPRRLTIAERVRVLEDREEADRKRQQALQIDVRWRAQFGERLASYQQAIYRITNGIDAATAGFQQAQSAQAQTDAMKTQALGLAISVATAAVFEPLCVAGLGLLGSRLTRLNLTTATIEKITERLENPVVAAVGGVATNIRGVSVAGQSAQRGQTPGVPANEAPGVDALPGSAAGAGSVAFLTSNLEALAGRQRDMEAAFARRAAQLGSLTDVEMKDFNPTATEGAYQAILNEMNRVCAGAERLQSAPAIASIYERFMWSAWIQQESNLAATIERMRRDVGRAQGGLGPARQGQPGDEVTYDIGTDIESRLMAIGVGSQAGVQLTGHWYSSNSPDNWRALLLAWARGYSESIAVAS